MPDSAHKNVAFSEDASMCRNYVMPTTDMKTVKGRSSNVKHSNICVHYLPTQICSIVVVKSISGTGVA